MSNKRRRIKDSGSVYTRKDDRVVGQYEINGRTRYIYGSDETEVPDSRIRQLLLEGRIFPHQKLSNGRRIMFGIA